MFKTLFVVFENIPVDCQQSQHDIVCYWYKRLDFLTGIIAQECFSFSFIPKLSFNKTLKGAVLQASLTNLFVNPELNNSSKQENKIEIITVDLVSKESVKTTVQENFGRWKYRFCSDSIPNLLGKL